MKRTILPNQKQSDYVFALFLASLLCIAMFFLRVIETGSWRYWFMLWNLFLAWLPLGVAWLLLKWLKRGRWLSRQGLGLTAIWLGFLPNSFYMLSDLIHLRVTNGNGLLYDVVLLSAFVFCGLMLGFTSVYIVHKELIIRLSRRDSHLLIAIIILLCSFAIYLGRYLRWNTWDLLLNPIGIVFDVSDRLINPIAYPRTFTTTASFFFLLGMMYVVGWYALAVVKTQNKT